MKFILLFLVTLLINVSSSLATPITVIDVMGRKVTVPSEPRRVILGESRYLYAISILDREDPFARLVGWRDGLSRYNPSSFEVYSKKFPKAKKLANFGNPMSSEFSVEKAVAVDADLVILSQFSNERDPNLIQKLEAVGIPVVVVDFKMKILENAITSFTLLGKLFNQEKRALEFTEYYKQQIELVLSRIQGQKDLKRPTVIFDLGSGWQPDHCCWIYGNRSFGKLVEVAGGENLGSQLFPVNKLAGEISREKLLDLDPDFLLTAGADWKKSQPLSQAVELGYAASKEQLQKEMKHLSQQTGWPSLKSIQNGNFHGIWHSFDDSPYHFIALQVLAKWFHPELFKDLDPEKTYQEFHERFLPIPFSGQFWVTYNSKS